ncbi:hypothetical protein [Nocardia fusca]|uniref:hypothetical protein n=1 Tax=Nocardia fusca TaxID=941183 RepID=UPI0007A74773|nr:hypothetical protein [Nocardia fusca]
MVTDGANGSTGPDSAGMPPPARLLLAGPGGPVTAAFPAARRVDSREDALGEIVRSVPAR